MENLPKGVELELECSRWERDIWLAQRVLTIMVSKRLQTASFAVTQKMDDAIFKGLPENQALWSYMESAMNRFLEVAQAELTD